MNSSVLLMSLILKRIGKTIDKTMGRCVSYQELVVLGVTDFSYTVIALNETLNMASHFSNNPFEFNSFAWLIFMNKQ